LPDAAAGLEELVAGELDVEVAAELDELLLHPAAASPVQAMAIRATTGALFLAKTGVIPRTLPLMVARRKESGHPSWRDAIFCS
jgi:hypothetical protein